MAMNPNEIAILVRSLTKTTTVDYRDEDLLVNVNQAYEETTADLMTETGGSDWVYGDFNYTAFPTYTITLRDSDPEYDLKEVSSIPLIILGVEILDQDGIARPITRTSLSKIKDKGIAQQEYFKDDGMPTEYEIRENIVVLYPAPDNGVSVTLASGLIIHYLRTASVITDITDTTTDLGLPSPFVDVIAYKAAIPNAIANGLRNINLLYKELERKEKKLFAFISKRDRDSRPIMTNKGILHI